MRFLIIFATILIVSIKAQKCGKLKTATSKLPWVVSIFSNKSDIVMCQGTIIDKKNVLTAGHCLEHKDPISLLVYSGLVFNRSMDEVESLFGNKKLWQIDQITVHPEKKLTARGRFINGGFVSSMSIHADLAIAKLKQEIEFNEVTFPICLPVDNSTVYSKIQGTYGGWDLKNNGIKLHNATVETIEDAEIFEIDEQERFVDFTSGTGLHSNMNDSWTLIGIKMMKNDDHQDGKPTTKFINIHKFVNWIMNVTQNSSSTQSLANGSNGNGTSLLSQVTENSLKMINGTKNIINSTILSTTSVASTTEKLRKTSVNPNESSTQKTETTEGSVSKKSSNIQESNNLTTGMPTEKLTAKPISIKFSEKNSFTTTLSSSKMTETPTERTTNLENSSTTQSSVTQNKESTGESILSTQSKEPSTSASDSTSFIISSSEMPTTGATNSLSNESLLQTTTNAIKTDENSSKHENSLMSTTSVTSSTPIINTKDKNKTESNKSFHNSQIDKPITAETSSKSSTNSKESTTEISVSSTLSSVSSENLTDIPKKLVSNLLTNANLPQGRSLKDFGNNLTNTTANLSVISIGLPSASFTKLTTILPVTQNIEDAMNNITNSSTLTDNQSPSTNVSVNANETLPIPQNSADSDGRKELLAGINLSPAIIIGGVFVASLLILLIVFGILGQAKPVVHDH